MMYDLISREIIAYSLEVTRIAGLILVAPLPWANAPMRVRVGLILVLAYLAHGIAAPLAVGMTSLQAALFAVPFEAVIGIAMGMVVRLSFAAMEMASDAIAPNIGLGAAQMFDPTTRTQTTSLAELLRLITVLVALFVGLHRAVLLALLSSFRVLAPGTLVNLPLSAPIMLRLSTDALVLSVRIAFPVLAVLLMTQIVLAFIARAAPSLQIFSIGFAVTLLVGGVVLTTALPDMMRQMIVDFTHVGGRIEGLIGTFVAG